MLVFAFHPVSGRVAAGAVFLEMRWESSGLVVGVVLLLGKGLPKVHEIVHGELAGFGDTVTHRLTADEDAIDARCGNSRTRFFQLGNECCWRAGHRNLTTDVGAHRIVVCSTAFFSSLPDCEATCLCGVSAIMLLFSMSFLSPWDSGK